MSKLYCRWPFGSNLKLSDYVDPPGVPVLQLRTFVATTAQGASAI